MFDEYRLTMQHSYMEDKIENLLGESVYVRAAALVGSTADSQKHVDKKIVMLDMVIDSEPSKSGVTNNEIFRNKIFNILISERLKSDGIKFDKDVPDGYDMQIEQPGLFVCSVAEHIKELVKRGNNLFFW